MSFTAALTKKKETGKNICFRPLGKSWIPQAKFN
jgi:hypothetical protein